jgi:membrane dipeptidase
MPSPTSPLRFSLLTLLLLVPVHGQGERVRRIQAQAIGIDTHIDTANRILVEGKDITQRLDDGQIDIPRLQQGGMRAPFFALWVPTFYHGAEAVRRTLELRDAMQRLFDAHPDQIELAVNAADIERIAATITGRTLPRTSLRTTG